MRRRAVPLPMLGSHPLFRIQSPIKLSTAYVTCSGRPMSPDASMAAPRRALQVQCMMPAVTTRLQRGMWEQLAVAVTLGQGSVSLSTPSIESSRYRYSTVLQFRIVATCYDELLEVAGYSYTGVMCPLWTACGIAVVEPSPWSSGESLQRFDFQLLSRTGLGR